MNTSKSPYFAALDLGSNSFHMLISRFENAQLETIDREQEMVQLASGLQANGTLSPEIQTKALECLKRFAERIKDIPPLQIRAVGTRTLRTLTDKGEFLEKAEKALGHPIEILSGFEEARLIYQGIAHSIVEDHKKRFVIDIGGGSSEFIIGYGNKPMLLESLGLGCVSYTERFDLRNNLTPDNINKAYNAACANIQKIRLTYDSLGWDQAVGTSGTMKTIASVLQKDDGGVLITRKSLKSLLEKIAKDAAFDDDSITKLRRQVLPAGIIILSAILDQFKIESIQVANATLKEGLMYDIVGRLNESDLRDQTVLKLQTQYSVDTDQAARVRESGEKFWSQIKKKLPEEQQLPAASRTKILRWAAQLHEIGLTMSHSGYHNHGHYILKHSDLAGFSRYEQYFLAKLVGLHRKNMMGDRFQKLDEETKATFIPLIVCLRIAVVINRSREDGLHMPELKYANEKYVLKFKSGWLTEHPLTLARLEQESVYLKAVGTSLTFE